MKKIILLVSFVLTVNLTACGYFLYPERVGQTKGEIDPAVVILDAAGLLFGVLPGVVAFAVDITTGAIYLPAGSDSVLDKHTKKLGQLELEAKPASAVSEAQRADIAEELSAITGRPVSPDDLVFYQTTSAPVGLALAGSLPRG